MTKAVTLVREDGSTYEYALTGEPLTAPPRSPFASRVVFAAAHVVMDPRRTTDPHRPVLDWNATLAYREYLWSLGFHVAEAMDTAQRGMGLDWPLALELIQRSTAAATQRGMGIASGAGTDHLEPGRAYTLREIEDAYTLQCEAIEAAGSRIILMASRALAATARHAEEYASVYTSLLRQARQPVILHWLGPMFDPALTGYWGSTDLPAAMENCLAVLRDAKEKIDGIKISLLDASLEVEMRHRLPEGIRLYTGDDFNFDHLILGDGRRHSDALLGIFDAIAPAASLALTALDAGDTASFQRWLAPTVPLSRHIFAAPTQYYKAGIVFLAYLNGFQDHFQMIGKMEAERPIAHLCELFVLADQCGVLRYPDVATERMHRFLSAAGVR